MRDLLQSGGKALLFIGRVILFLAAMVILYYEFVIGPRHGERPDPTIVIASIGLAAACISLKWSWK